MFVRGWIRPCSALAVEASGLPGNPVPGGATGLAARPCGRPALPLPRRRRAEKQGEARGRKAVPAELSSAPPQCAVSPPTVTAGRKLASRRRARIPRRGGRNPASEGGEKPASRRRETRPLVEGKPALRRRRSRPQRTGKPACGQDRPAHDGREPSRRRKRRPAPAREAAAPGEAQTSDRATPPPLAGEKATPPSDTTAQVSDTVAPVERHSHPWRGEPLLLRQCPQAAQCPVLCHPYGPW